MLTFQWEALRHGDTVFVHDVSDADLGRRAGVVSTGTATGPVVRPGRFAVQLAAVDDGCWRCRESRPSRSDLGVVPGPALSGVR